MTLLLGVAVLQLARKIPRLYDLEVIRAVPVRGAQSGPSAASARSRRCSGSPPPAAAHGERPCPRSLLDYCLDDGGRQLARALSALAVAVVLGRWLWL